MTLADMLNSPSEIKYDGKTYLLRQPTLLEQGTFQRYLEQRAYDAIERRDYQDARQQDRDRNALNRDVAAGVYEWGGEVCCQSLQTQTGIAKLLNILLRDQGVTEELARKIVDRQVKEIAAVLASKAVSDPKALGQILSSLGLPENFLSTVSSAPPSSTESITSAASPMTNSSDSTTSPTTSPAPPG